MRQLLRVHLHVVNAVHDGNSEDNSDDNRTEEVRLLFPAYYEEAIENSPVRIEVRESNSCGHRYRYCFTRRIFQFPQYDSLFAYAEVYERAEIAAELAISRLLFPHGLSEAGRKRYTEYLKTNWEAAGKILMNHSNPGRAATNLVPGMMPWFVEQILENPSEEMLQTLTGHAQSAQDTETVSWLMNYRHERYGQTGGSRDESRKMKRRKARFTLDESGDRDS